MKKLVLILIVIVVCGAAVWLGTRYKPTADGQPAQATNASLPSASPSPEAGRTPSSFFQRREHAKTGAQSDDIWEQEVNAVLASQASDAEIADKLLKLYPQVPADAQADLFVEITQHVPNEDYRKLANVLTNSTSPPEVLDVLLNDLIDRPDKLRMPLLMDLMRDKQNPKSDEAHDFLEVIIGDDYGEDWDTWSKKIAEWMALHPDDPAPNP